MSDISILHNPRCSKSRQALALLEGAGIEPTVIKYLDNPPKAQELRDILSKLKIEARALLRTGEAAYKELGLADTSLSESKLIQAMVQHPKLIERPIVIRGNRAEIGRPPERVLNLIR